MAVLDPLAILLVEDDEAARAILASMLALRFPRIALLLAENGATGLESFKKHLPALVITDVNMPVMSGIRLTQEIRQIADAVKVIVLTAFSDKSLLENSGPAGISHYLLKPVDYRKLLLAIEQCLGETMAQPSTGAPIGGMP
jgi:two-component system, sensor histidine kinase and response regulator